MADKLPFTVTVHALVPLQAPLQPAKYDPVAATGVNFTDVLAANVAEHVGLQLSPAGLLVTIPLPVPDSVTARRYRVEGLAEAWAAKVSDVDAANIATRIAYIRSFGMSPLRGLRTHTPPSQSCKTCYWMTLLESAVGRKC